RLEEQLDVEPFLELNVLCSAQVELEEIVSADLVIADFVALAGGETFPRENSFHGLRVAVLSAVHGELQCGVQHCGTQVEGGVVLRVVIRNDVGPGVATAPEKDIVA